MEVLSPRGANVSGGPTSDVTGSDDEVDLRGAPTMLGPRKQRNLPSVTVTHPRRAVQSLGLDLWD